MVDEREVLIRAFDTLPQATVTGPDDGGRVHVELGVQGFLDLGDHSSIAAQAALAWRTRRLQAWLAQEAVQA